MFTWWYNFALQYLFSVFAFWRWYTIYLLQMLKLLLPLLALALQNGKDYCMEYFCFVLFCFLFVCFCYKFTLFNTQPKDIDGYVTTPTGLSIETDPLSSTLKMSTHLCVPTSFTPLLKWMATIWHLSSGTTRVLHGWRECKNVYTVCSV